MTNAANDNVFFTLTHPYEVTFMKEMEAYFGGIYYAN